jgi:hypothetical protein
MLINPLTTGTTNCSKENRPTDAIDEPLLKIIKAPVRKVYDKAR